MSGERERHAKSVRDAVPLDLERVRQMSSTKAQRWARCPPGLAWKPPGLPTEWVPVLERNEEVMEQEPRPGYVWVDVHGAGSTSGPTTWSSGRRIVTDRDRPLVECHGGPWDGLLIVDRGPQFPVSAQLVEDGTLLPRCSRELGIYERRACALQRRGREDWRDRGERRHQLRRPQYRLEGAGRAGARLRSKRRRQWRYG
jgi:hypothetical protein